MDFLDPTPSPLHRALEAMFSQPLVEHLPGKHNQASHGRGGGAVDGRSAGLRKALDEHEARIVKIKGGEEAVILGPDGSVVATKRAMGDPDGAGPAIAGVSFTDREAAKFEGKVLTHNHPGEGGLSAADVSFAVNSKLAEIRAVDDKYLYSLRPGSTKWSPEHLHEVAPAYDLVYDGVYARLQGQVWSGLITPEQASTATMHAVLTEFTRITGWEYTRTNR